MAKGWRTRPTGATAVRAAAASSAERQRSKERGWTGGCILQFKRTIIQAITGVAGALLAQTWLDALPGDWAALDGAIALAVTAIAATVTGIASHLGRPGIGVGAVLMVLVANPWSGLASAPELLPEPAGAIGQLMPTGAAGSLLRSAAYFDGAAAAEHVVVLAAWALAGLALIGAAALRGGAVARRLDPRGRRAPRALA